MQVALLVGLLAWTTLSLGGYRAETMVVTVMLSAALLATHFLSRAVGTTRGQDGERDRRAGPPLHPAGWLLLPFLAYALWNVLWVAPAGWLGWADWLGWAQMVAVFWVVVNGIRARAARRVVFLSLVALALVGVFAACYQVFVNPTWAMLGRTQVAQFHGRASGTFGIPNSFAGFLILLLPATIALAVRVKARATERVWWGWVSAVAALGLFLTLSRGGWLALAVALAAWPLLNARWSWQRRAVGTVVVLVLLAVAVLAVFRTSSRARERLTAFVTDAGEVTRPLIWQAAIKLFREQPITGTGAGSYNLLFERHRPAGFRDEPQWAHNEYLNTLSDYGLAGVLLWFGACGVIALRWGRGRTSGAEGESRDWIDAPDMRLGMAIGALAFALHLATEFHFKMPALAVAFATMAGLMIRRSRGPRMVDGTRGGHRVGNVAVVAAVLAGAWLVVPWQRGEAARAEARDILDRIAAAPSARSDEQARLKRAEELLRGAVRSAPDNGQAWADLAYVIALSSRLAGGRDAEFGQQAEAAAERALATTRGNYEFWVRRGVARAMQGRWMEADTDFAEAVKLAPKNALAWYYQAECFSRRRATIQLATVSLVFCLRLDPWNGPALALRQRLAISAGPR